MIIRNKQTVFLKTEVPIRILFHDVDSMNVVWHGNYVKYFEEGRSALLNMIGFHYNDMSAAGFVLPIVDMKIKYIRPLLLNQVVIVCTELIEYQNRLIMHFTIMDEEKNQIYTRGSTTQVSVCINSREMQFELPLVFIEAIENAMQKTKEIK